MAISLRDALAQLNDPRTVAHGVVWTALNAGITLVDPHRLGPGRRLAYRAALGALGGWTAWVSARDAAPATRAGLTAGAAGAFLAASEATEAVDARLQQGLARRGVADPRGVMALAAVALAALTWALGRAPAPVAAPEPEEDPVAQTVDLPDDVRALTALLLGATEQFGAAELREQLASARASIYEGADPTAFWPGIGFEVPEGSPFAVPGDAIFPVIGVYRPLEGRTFEVYLNVSNGHLSTLSISEGRGWTDAEQQSWYEQGRGVQELPGWPDPSELELLIESPAGLRPLS